MIHPESRDHLLSHPPTRTGRHLSFWRHISLWSLQRHLQHSLLCEGIQIIYINAIGARAALEYSFQNRWKCLYVINKGVNLVQCWVAFISTYPVLLTVLLGIVSARRVGCSCDQLRIVWHHYETQLLEVTLGWLCFWIDCGEIAHSFIFLIELQRDLSPRWKCQEPAKQRERNKLGQGYGKRSMYLAYWECREREREEKRAQKKKCSASLYLQVIKDRCYVCNAIELWQPKLVSLSNKDCSVFSPLKLEIKSQESGISCTTQR